MSVSSHESKQQPVPYYTGGMLHSTNRQKSIEIKSILFSYPIRLNYSNLMNAIKDKTHLPLSKDINLLNCAVDCIDFSNEDARYISPFSEHLTRPKLSRMMSEESNPPELLFDAVYTGDFSAFGSKQQAVPTEAGFKRILQNIDLFEDIQNLINEVRFLIDSDSTINDLNKNRLLAPLDKRTYHGITICPSDKEACFLFGCFLYTLNHGNNTAVRGLKLQAKQIQDAAIVHTKSLSNDAKLLYEEERQFEALQQIIESIENIPNESSNKDAADNLSTEASDSMQTTFN